MWNNLKNTGKDMAMAAVKKYIIAAIAPGCAVVFAFGLFAVAALYVMSEFKGDFSIALGKSDFEKIADTNPIYPSLFEEAIETYNNTHAGASGTYDISGPLLASTLSITELYNSDVNLKVLDRYTTYEDFKEFNSASSPGAQFPTWDLMLEMAMEQIGEHRTLHCGVWVEVPDGDGGTTTVCQRTRSIPYWEEYVIGGLIPRPTCEPEECDDGTDIEHMISYEVYKNYYLNLIYFPKPETLNLDKVKDAIVINRRSDQVFEKHDDYLALIYAQTAGSYSKEFPQLIGDTYAPLLGPLNITSHFNQNRRATIGDIHPGVDLACNAGDPVFAIIGGKISSTALLETSYGHHVVESTELEGIGPVKIWYAHMNDVLVRTGETVDGGKQVGTCGSTGHSTGAHLHIEIRYVGGEDCGSVGGVVITNRLSSGGSWTACFIDVESLLTGSQ